jgi:hypothetical protein
MSRADSTHHHGPLAGLGAGAAAVLTGGGLILIAARRQLGEVATVLAWALMAAVILAVAAAAFYVFLRLRYHALHPETLVRQAVRAEVVTPRQEAPGLAWTAREIQADGPAPIGPSAGVHIHIHAADPAEAAGIIRQALPGPAGDITEGNDRCVYTSAHLSWVRMKSGA